MTIKEVNHQKMVVSKEMNGGIKIVINILLLRTV
jgi:hypothetical protein